MTTMYQCKLQQGNKFTTGYIEERGARLNVSVEIPELGGLWQVIEVGTSIDSATLQKKQVADRKQREASDI